MHEAIYTVELTSAYPEWWRYNIYLSVVEFDATGRMTGYRNAVDRIYEIEEGSGGPPRHAPAGWSAAARVPSVTTAPCDHIAVYLYVIANTFPASELIRDSPPFPAELVVRQNNKNNTPKELFRQTCDVNQWGGLTISALNIPSPT